MNKNDLIEKVAGETGLMKRDVRAAVNTTLKVISRTLEGGEKVTLVGFGTFQAVDRKARSGRNPQTGERMQIPDKRVPKFKAGKPLKEKVT